MLTFFDVPIKVISNSAGVINRIEFVFRNYLSPKTEPLISFSVAISNTGDFFNADELFEKSIITNDNIRVIYTYDGSKYYEWVFPDTFLPPLQIHPLKGLFTVSHGCSVSDGKDTFAIIAPSLAGKTSLTLYLLSNGFKCITDDLTFIDSHNQVIPYKKPVGIRETGLDIIPSLRYLVKDLIDEDTLVFLNNEKRKTWLLHLEDIFGNDVYLDQTTRIDYILVPDKSKKGTAMNLNIVETFNTIYYSLCNSGLDNKEKQNRVISLMNSIKGAYYLPTLDLHEAYTNIMQIGNSSKGCF